MYCVATKWNRTRMQLIVVVLQIYSRKSSLVSAKTPITESDGDVDAPHSEMKLIDLLTTEYIWYI